MLFCYLFFVFIYLNHLLYDYQHDDDYYHYCHHRQHRLFIQNIFIVSKILGLGSINRPNEWYYKYLYCLTSSGLAEIQRARKVRIEWNNCAQQFPCILCEKGYRDQELGCHEKVGYAMKKNINIAFMAKNRYFMDNKIFLWIFRRFWENHSLNWDEKWSFISLICMCRSNICLSAQFLSFSAGISAWKIQRHYNQKCIFNEYKYIF